MILRINTGYFSITSLTSSPLKWRHSVTHDSETYILNTILILFKYYFDKL